MSPLFLVFSSDKANFLENVRIVFINNELIFNASVYIREKNSEKIQAEKN